MCGIVGAVSLSGAPLATRATKAMVDVIAHRGPDDAGYLVWQSGRAHERGKSFGQAFTDSRFQSICPLLPLIDSPAGEQRLREHPWDVFLGHRRLSIIDLSPAGHQPMADVSGSTWIAYNGEIYNYREIREELEGEGYRFAGQSDTEVLLYAFEKWGIECVHHLNGMFAFAIWDSAASRLYLARDRYGIKPLYYVESADTLVFGSEIKSLLLYPGVERAVDLLALNEYFSFQNIFTDRTLFENIKLLPPGNILSVELRPPGFTGFTGSTRERYWDFDFSVESERSSADLQEELAERIQRAVVRQCVSDVPVGSYLSGGMDSGTITVLATQALGRICTFTGGFDLSEAAEHERTFDEREPAEHMANLFQTEHYECVLHSGDMEEVMDRLVWHLEDLRIGQSYPNYYVSRLASKFVKVVLAGTGGDELFGGYPWRYAAAVGPTGEEYIQNYYRYWQRLVANRDKPRLFNDETVRKLQELREGTAIPFKTHTLSVFQNVFGSGVSATRAADQVRHSLYFECKTFLHGLLVVEDKLSMAHSLETRVPFLDNDLVDFACRVPVTLKVAGIEHLARIDENLPTRRRNYQLAEISGKSILRQTMPRLLPPEITQARKQGFSAPDESWFRGRSEQYVRDLLLDPGAGIRDYLSREYVEEVLDEHSSGRQNRRLLIWSFLCFEKWLDAFL